MPLLPAFQGFEFLLFTLECSISPPTNNGLVPFRTEHPTLGAESAGDVAQRLEPQYFAYLKQPHL